MSEETVTGRDRDGTDGPVREPPIEDLFSFEYDEVDFMSAKSFPASDPPPPQWELSQIDPTEDR